MAIRYKFLNSPSPQTVSAGAVSAVLGCSDVVVTNGTACFICVSPDGTGVNGSIVAAGNAHYIPANVPVVLSDLNAAFKIGVNAGTLYISAVG